MSAGIRCAGQGDKTTANPDTDSRTFRAEHIARRLANFRIVSPRRDNANINDDRRPHDGAEGLTHPFACCFLMTIL